MACVKELVREAGLLGREGTFRWALCLDPSALMRDAIATGTALVGTEAEKEPRQVVGS